MFRRLHHWWISYFPIVFSNCEIWAGLESSQKCPQWEKKRNVKRKSNGNINMKHTALYFAKRCLGLNILMPHCSNERRGGLNFYVI